MTLVNNSDLLAVVRRPAWKDGREVSVVTIEGGVALGRIDDMGRLVYLSGLWIPEDDPERRDRVFRSRVREIIDDGGLTYKKKLVRFLPQSWLDGE